VRRRLILVFLAVSSLVTIAFVVPLGFLVRQTAQDRALDAARADAAAVVPTLVGDGTREQIEVAIAATEAGQRGRVTVFASQGWVVGADVVVSSRVDAALTSGQSGIGEIGGGMEGVAAVATGPQELSAVRVSVPESELRRGQWRAWGVLAGVGAVLIGISVIVADRMARTIVRPAQSLARAARELGDGQLDATVDPEGPIELVELAVVFNDLGSLVSSMLVRERELVAELSHRLRTPLTTLRLRLDQVADDGLSAELRNDVDDVTAVVNDLIHEARGTFAPATGCDLSEAVAERAEFWSVLAEDQERVWHFEHGGGGLWVDVARTDLVAAVDVLMQNVFAHTPDGTPLTIGFGQSDRIHEQPMVKLWVSDGGNGIDPERLERGESSMGSTGLGLDIARRLAEGAGGSFEIGTGTHGGAEVALRFPLRPAPTG